MFRVFPAPAGINRFRKFKNVGAWRVPRASGDKPEYRFITAEMWMCSPRQRG